MKKTFCFDIDGVIATNTSVSRPDYLQDKIISKEQGGLSGAPIKDFSTDIIRLLFSELFSE